MEIPEIPIIPIDIDDEARNFLQSLEGRILRINAAIFKDGCLHILGIAGTIDTPNYFEIVYQKGHGEVRNNYFTAPDTTGSIFASIGTLGFYRLTQSMRARKREERQYDENVEKFIEANEKEAEEKTKDIKIYQLTSLDDIEKVTGKEVEVVDIGPENFLRAENEFLLKIKAYLLGANVISCYQILSDESILGTPLRYKEV